MTAQIARIPRRRRQHDLSCVRCGSGFRATRRDAQYCSDRCRRQASRAAKEIPGLSTEAMLVLAEHGLIDADMDNRAATARAIDLVETLAQTGDVDRLVDLLERASLDIFGI